MRHYILQIEGKRLHVLLSLTFTKKVNVTGDNGLYFEITILL